MSQGNKKITTRKIPAANNKVLVRTGSFHFSQEIPATDYKISSVPGPVHETVRKINNPLFLLN